MTIAADMCEIVESHAGEKLRFFIEVDAETHDQRVLYARDDLEWDEAKADAVDAELHELVAKGSYEKHMDAGDVTHIVKVADEMVMFTGFIADNVIVITFERGVLAEIGGMIDGFRDYLLENDIEFISLESPD